MKIFRALTEKKVLGINRRIGQYILKNNPRKFYPLVDDKWNTYQLCKSLGIPTPKHFALIEDFGDIQTWKSLLPLDSGFVLKPAKGGMGNGILIVKRTNLSPNGMERFERMDGGFWNNKQIKHHISNILSGLYSLDGNTDRAILQEVLDIHPFFENITFLGIPDIRIIVYHGYPVMAMLRLPTKQSGGKANLHQGAIGVGIALDSGALTFTIWKDRLIEKHPDTDQKLFGRMLPYWKEMLEMSALSYEATNLGYLGVDLVLLPNKGPVLLEMNARPGLAIQLANQKGLLENLEKVESWKSERGYEPAGKRVQNILEGRLLGTE